MNLIDIMTWFLYFKDTMKSGLSSVTKRASQKLSRQHFGGNQGGNSNGPVPMELGHIKPQDKSRKILSRVNYNNFSQIGYYAKVCL